MFNDVIADTARGSGVRTRSIAGCSRNDGRESRSEMRGYGTRPEARSVAGSRVLQHSLSRLPSDCKILCIWGQKCGEGGGS